MLSTAERWEGRKNRILIIGGTGYLAKYMAKSSISLNYPTYVLVRPESLAPNSCRAGKLQELTDMGIRMLRGSLDDHKSLINAFKQVDIVISSVAIPQHMDQLKIIRAIQEVGNIKRFLPSEFGNDVDRVEALPPFQKVCDDKKVIRRAIEQAGIPYSFISANSFAAYFVDYFIHPRRNPQPEEVVIYGDGLTKAVLNLEDDVAAFTIMVANDPRTLNKLVIYRPPGNIISQSELISLWEKKTGTTFKRVFLSESDMINLSETLPHPDNIPVYYKYSPIEAFLDASISAPRHTKLTSFA
ncbi:hypothetical protein SUGI_0705380 [Cryptomeria japonica]|nr:hypothetical protein SUGI_0705380 [Cryptomeria japonica]